MHNLKLKLLNKVIICILLTYFFCLPNIFLSTVDSWWLKAVNQQSNDLFVITEISNRFLFPSIIFLIKKIFFLSNDSNRIIHIILIQIFFIINLSTLANYLIKKNFNNILIICIIFSLGGYVTTNLRFPVYNDLLVTFFLLNSLFAKKLFNSCLYFILACFSHEIAIFSLPFLLLVNLRKFSAKKKEVILLSSIFAIIFILFYVLIKIKISSIDPQTNELKYIFSNKIIFLNHVSSTLQLAWLGIFSAFKFMWVIFIIIILYYKKKFFLIKNKKFILFLILYFLLLILLTSFYSIDKTRHAYLLFFIPLISVMLKFFQIYKRRFMSILCLISQMVIPNFSVFGKIYIIHPLGLDILYKWEKIRILLNL
jgi:hypothetical protein